MVPVPEDPLDAYRWAGRGERRPLVCRVCGFDGAGRVLLSFASGESDSTAAECPQCGSIDLVPFPLPFTPSESSVDVYVELMGGLGALAEFVEVLAQAPGDRLLDVGCGYGFALDFARWKHGWAVVGVEPSTFAARRGAADLGIDIRNEPLTADTDLGDAFPLVLCSEVLEHVTDPLELLRQIARRMTPDGTLLLTTPDAAVVHRDSNDGEIVDVLSAGLHVFLASRQGLEGLLARAGFRTVRIARTGLSHRVLARRDGGEVGDPTSTPSVASSVLGYCRSRADEIAAVGPLAIGLRTRALRNASAIGDFAGMANDVAALRPSLRQATGVDLTSPRRVRATTRGGPVPLLVPIAFSLGVRELLSGDPRRAAEWFEISAGNARAQLDAGGIRGSESRDLLLQATYHLALAQTRKSPKDAVATAMRSLPEAIAALGEPTAPLSRWRARILVDLLNLGHLDAAQPLVPVVAADVVDLSCGSGEDRAAGRDALLVLGVRAIQRGDTIEARHYLSTLTELPDDGSPHDLDTRRAVERALEGIRARDYPVNGLATTGKDPL